MKRFKRPITYVCVFAMIVFLIVMMLPIAAEEVDTTNTSEQDSKEISNTEERNALDDSDVQDVVSASMSEVQAQPFAANVIVDDLTSLTTAISAAPSDGSLYTIEVAASISLSETLTIAAGKNIVLQSSVGNVFTLRKTSIGKHFSIEGSLTLTDIILDGSSDGSMETASGGGITLAASSANVTMNAGSAIQYCYSTTTATVYFSPYGTFLMNGGSIHYNQVVGSGITGAGVNVNRGTFTMNGGNISNNIANSIVSQSASGGGIYISTGTFTMNNGEISGNQTLSGSNNSYGGGIAIEGSADNLRGKFNMYNGKIANNSAITTYSGASGGGGAIEARYATIMMNGGIISGNRCSGGQSTGGAVLVGPYTSFTMNGGTIGGDSESDANVSAAEGGGVYVYRNTYAATFAMNGGAIKGNRAVLGGGAYVGMPLTITGTASISNNVTTGNGGGLYIADTGSLTTTAGSHVTFANNHALNGNGGAIYTDVANYGNIHTVNTTTFENNIAAKAFTPPVNAATTYPDMQFATTSITTHLLNNYDINYLLGTQISYNLTYNANGGMGSYVASFHPLVSSPILSSNETGITRLGYGLIGWNSDPEGTGEYYMVGEEISLNGNVTLYALWELNEYDIIFDSNGGSLVDAQVVAHGEQIEEPSDPTREGYVFAGWYTDNGTFLEAWDFDDTASEDVTLYAKWSAQEYDITFDSNGGSLVDAQVVAYGEQIEEPSNPTREGYVFAGWYTDNGAFLEAWDFDSLVSEAVTLYANWAIAEYTIMFDSNGGSVIEPQVIAYGSRIERPSNPTREGYVFAGWYMDNGTFRKAWDFDDIIQENITLYAKWDAKNGTGGSNNQNGSGNPAKAGSIKTGDLAKPWFSLVAGSLLAIGLLCYKHRLRKKNT